MISLPYLYDLRKKLPEGTKLDLLVREEAEQIPRSFTFFDTIYTVKGGRNTRLQFIYFLLMYPKLLLKGYDVVLDLQNIKLSRIIRKLLFVKAWTQFDRYSTNYAGNRYKNTINVMDLAQVEFRKLDQLKIINRDELLSKFGLKKNIPYIIINPAGAFENRNWMLDNYVEFCRLWNERINKDAQFIVIGIEKVSAKAKYLKEKLGNNLIDLTCRTTQEEALHLLLQCYLMVTEDSGLMHMNYCLGKPTIGILGSTRNDWTNPLLPHTHFFNSSDMSCGNCMLLNCRFKEIKCLTRIKPEMVLEASVSLLNKLGVKDPISQ